MAARLALRQRAPFGFIETQAFGLQHVCSRQLAKDQGEAISLEIAGGRTRIRTRDLDGVRSSQAHEMQT